MDNEQRYRTLNDNALINIENLHVQFHMREGVVRALRGIDLEIRRGETLGLVGESGCGKSVTAQAILRIIPKPGRIAQGRILLARRRRDSLPDLVDLTELDPRGREIRDIRGQDVAMIFQEPMTSLSPVHTVGNQIIEAIRLHQHATKEEARQRAIEMLGLVGIPCPELRVDAYSFELSGGMRQRAMIAIALSCNPSLLIADEPTTALDVTIQAQILELMQQLQQELNMSILMITHNLGVIAALSHRVAVMYLGRIVEQAPKEAIFSDPRHPYTQGLLHSVPRIGETKGKRLWAIQGVVPHPYAHVSGCAFHPRCPKFMPGVCDQDLPPTVEFAPEHTVACYLYNSEETQ